jgi:hypothetical protein
MPSTHRKIWFPGREFDGSQFDNDLETRIAEKLAEACAFTWHIWDIFEGELGKRGLAEEFPPVMVFSKYVAGVEVFFLQILVRDWDFGACLGIVRYPVVISIIAATC